MKTKRQLFLFLYRWQCWWLSAPLVRVNPTNPESVKQEVMDYVHKFI
ncbi:MAG: hypothetical protein IJS49_05625 [Paludibacteraceae bacterium]|nr:hypothetical protein [Paludibacteraceae bacterium]